CINKYEKEKEYRKSLFPCFLFQLFPSLQMPVDDQKKHTGGQHGTDTVGKRLGIESSLGRKEQRQYQSGNHIKAFAEYGQSQSCLCPFQSRQTIYKNILEA